MARVVGIVLGLAILAALAFVIGRAVSRAVDRRRERAARPWAVKLAERLEDEGRRRGRARHRSEPVTGDAAALGDDVLPDPRLADVGRAVSASLFGPRGVDDGVAPWAEQVVDEVVAAHPVARRVDRFSSGRGARPTRGSGA